MPNNKSFTVTVEFDTSFSVDELWPDGDAPENPTIDDVKKLICNDLNVSMDALNKQSINYVRLLQDWSMDYDGHLTVSSCQPTPPLPEKTQDIIDSIRNELGKGPFY